MQGTCEARTSSRCRSRMALAWRAAWSLAESILLCLIMSASFSSCESISMLVLICGSVTASRYPPVVITCMVGGVGVSSMGTTSQSNEPHIFLIWLFFSETHGVHDLIYIEWSGSERSLTSSKAKTSSKAASDTRSSVMPPATSGTTVSRTFESLVLWS